VQKDRIGTWDISCLTIGVGWVPSTMVRIGKARKGDKSHPPNFVRLLRARRERPRGRRAAEQPSSVMNSRRLMSDMGACSPALCQRRIPEGHGAARSVCRTLSGQVLGQTLIVLNRGVGGRPLMCLKLPLG